MIKIQLASDLHLEMNKSFELTQTDSDIIVLAGDIAVGIKGAQYAIKLHEKHKKPVVYVPGNHEFYRHEYNELLSEIKSLLEPYQNVNLLDNSSWEYKGVRFIGATFWTDFVGNGSQSTKYNMKVVNECLSDHHLIMFNDELFTTCDALELHNLSRQWLEIELAKPYEGKTVVVTHHGPSLICQHPHFMYSAISTGFLSDADELVKEADAWLFGHTHFNMDTVVGDCRLVSNQLGYPSENMPTPYSSDLIIRI